MLSAHDLRAEKRHGLSTQMAQVTYLMHDFPKNHYTRLPSPFIHTTETSSHQTRITVSRGIVEHSLYIQTTGKVDKPFSRPTPHQAGHPSLSTIDNGHWHHNLAPHARHILSSWASVTLKHELLAFASLHARLNRAS